MIHFQNKLPLKITGNQAVSLRSFPLFRSAVPVGLHYFCGITYFNLTIRNPELVEGPSIPQTRRSHNKNSSLTRACQGVLALAK